MLWNAFSQKRRFRGEGSEVGVFAVTVHTMSFLVCMISTLWSMRFCISMSMFRRCVADSGNLDLIFARIIK